MTTPFFYSKPSCCVKLPSSHHRRTLLAVNDALFVLIEEDYSDPDADPTLRVLPRLREGESTGSKAPASSLDIAISREHLPLGCAGSERTAPCVLSYSAPAFYMFNVAQKRLLMVDTRLDRESTQLHVMQYYEGRTPFLQPSKINEMSAMGLDADGKTPLFTYVFHMSNWHYWIQFLRIKLDIDRRDVCELENLHIREGRQLQYRNEGLSIVSDGKQKVAISTVHVIDVYDCLLHTLIYSIRITAGHSRPSRRVSVIFTMLYGEEWILCAGKLVAVRVAANEQTWREVFPPPLYRDDDVNSVALGRDLYYCCDDGIYVMNEGPAPLERIARDICVANTEQSIRRRYPGIANYPVEVFYAIMSHDVTPLNIWIRYYGV